MDLFRWTFREGDDARGARGSRTRLRLLEPGAGRERKPDPGPNRTIVQPPGELIAALESDSRRKPIAQPEPEPKPRCLPEPHAAAQRVAGASTGLVASHSDAGR